MTFCVFKEKEKNNVFQGTEIAIAADGNISLAFLLIFLLVILSSEESNLIAPPQTLAFLETQALYILFYSEYYVALSEVLLLLCP